MASKKPTVAFILGAGAHSPYGFPVGDDLKTAVAELFQATIDSREGQESKYVDRLARAKITLMNCGVSIDRYLSNNPEFDDLIRPAIASVLLEFEARAENDFGMIDWIKYLWPSMIIGRGQLTDRFRFVTFNYDRTLEFRLFAACFSLWGSLDLADAYKLVSDLSIYHVYGSLGEFYHPDANDEITYGETKLCHEAAKFIKIIGEHDKQTTKEIHKRIADAEYIFILGCHYHPENMSLLALDQLPKGKHRHIYGSCFGMTYAERDYLQDSYGFIDFQDPTWKAVDLLSNLPEFQQLR